MVTGSSGIMTNLEALVMEWLIKNKIPYEFQTSLMGGFYALGGSVVDFILPDNICLRIHGEYWHRGIEASGRDIIQREQLQGMGYIVVDIWGEDIENPVRLNEAMRLALVGREMLK